VTAQSEPQAKPSSVKKVLLTYEELAEATSLCVAFLYELKKEGMPFVPVGRRTRFDPVEVVAWFKKRRKGTKHVNISD
jgi:hypothetical protein